MCVPPALFILLEQQKKGFFANQRLISAILKT